MQTIEAILLEPVGCLAESPSAPIYEDVVPVLAELKTMGIRLYIATSLSRADATSFVERHSLGEFFSGIWDSIGAALAGASLPPEKTMFLTDTAEGIKAARAAGVHPILMMNDPDEARRLAMHNPAGGIVSLHEMPDFIRLIAARNKTG